MLVKWRKAKVAILYSILYFAGKQCRQLKEKSDVATFGFLLVVTADAAVVVQAATLVVEAAVVAV